MQPDISAYLLFLAVGVVAIFIDGRFIRRSGATYLKEVYRDPTVADSANRLVNATFHVGLLGIFALVAVFPGGSSIENLVGRLGVLLLMMAAAHGLTIWVFTRMRGRQHEQQLQDEIAVRSEERMEEESQPPSVPRPSKQPAPEGDIRPPHQHERQ